ncbi:hypothetical protein [Chitiniphilus eburneus]|uniref:Uncharacterized protein n=1 Tax=Chitiniphilus eburneus TaxID=2571148 RepID=A0A4U0Q5W1_9NEIS|nr:hypothetical protein [Chitiniphilus eburneus]TJZ75572.1 hypothetical protein FAZ21_06555 [Chitiniphilus eburneus]
MKTIIFAVSTGLASCAFAAKPVEIVTLITQNYGVKTGEQFDYSGTPFLLTNKKCALPIVNAKDMRHFESPNLRHMKDFGAVDGCWYLTLDKRVIVIFSDGRMDNAGYLQQYMPIKVISEKMAIKLDDSELEKKSVKRN